MVRPGYSVLPADILPDILRINTVRVVRAYPNPWKIGIPTILNGINNGHTLIIHAYIINGGIPHKTYTGYLSLYDALGNRIINSMQGLADTNKKKIVFTWDGKNQNSRIVGASSYVGLVKVEIDDFIDESRVIIGVK